MRRILLQLVVIALLYRGYQVKWQGWREIDLLGHYGGYWTAQKVGKKTLYAAYPGGQGELPHNFFTFDAKRGQQILCHLETEELMEPYKAEALARLKKEIDRASKTK